MAPEKKFIIRLGEKNDKSQETIKEVHGEHSELTVFKWMLQRLARMLGGPRGLKKKATSLTFSLMSLIYFDCLFFVPKPIFFSCGL